MYKFILIFISGVIFGSVVTGFVYSKYQRERQLADFVLLYSKKANDFSILKEKSTNEIVCLNYILTKGDIDILSNIESSIPKYFLSKESKWVINQYKKTISEFNKIDPKRYGCKDT